VASPRLRDAFFWFLSAVITLVLTDASFASDSNEWTIHHFETHAGGEGPVGNLVSDSAGNLYGVTRAWGAFGYGTVYELQRPVAPSEAWTHIILYSFVNNGDGEGPSSGVIFDAAGNLYGTTSGGYSLSSGYTAPNVFELSPPVTEGGTWTESVLVSNPGTGSPIGLVIDGAGSLYGVTSDGLGGYDPNCPQGCGTMYKLTPPATGSGPWTETVLQNFGEGPNSIPIVDGRGNLYGSTTTWGSGAGLVYALIPPAKEGGNWTYRVLYDFSATTESPVGSLTLHNDGRLYGLSGPRYNGTDAGTVFELVPPETFGEAWTENTLHTFSGPDGFVTRTPPSAKVIFDPAGNMYGTTVQGGDGHCYVQSGCGVVFKLSPPPVEGAAWTETVLFDFLGVAGGVNPAGGLIFDKRGVLVGATSGVPGAEKISGGAVFGVTK